jgi:hypothetical protein
MRPAAGQVGGISDLSANVDRRQKKPWSLILQGFPDFPSRPVLDLSGAVEWEEEDRNASKMPPEAAPRLDS